MLYQGSCHCGAVRYEVELDLEKPVMECNCSHCQMKGFLLSFAQKEDFKLLSGEDVLTEYRFNTHKLSHVFCKICGAQCFAFGISPEGVDTAAINVRTLKDINLEDITRFSVDGKSL